MKLLVEIALVLLLAGLLVAAVLHIRKHRHCERCTKRGTCPHSRARDPE